MKNNIKGMQIVWKNPLWPKIKLIIFDVKLYFLPILDLVSSISGKIEKKIAIRINKIVFSMLKKFKANKETKSPKAKWV